jgi:Fur family ferric uptake transcriptional regulator
MSRLQRAGSLARIRHIPDYLSDYSSAPFSATVSGMTKASPDQAAQQLRQQASGRITPARTSVLSILLAAEAALSHQEIEHTAQQQGLSFDRVTLYRALDWLVEQGIAHKISGTDRTWRYNAQAGTPHQHAHFHCKRCEQVYCLENLQPAVMFALPNGYQLEQVEVNLQGICPACATA